MSVSKEQMDEIERVFAEAPVAALKAKLAAAEATVSRINDLCDYAEEFYLGTPTDMIKVTIRQVREDLESRDTRSVSSSLRRSAARAGGEK